MSFRVITVKDDAPPATRVEMIEIEVLGADPSGEIVIELDSSGADARFAPGPFIATAVDPEPGLDPGVEFVTIDPSEVTISMRGGRDPVDFRIHLAIEGDPEMESYRLGAHAAPGTAVNAMTRGRPSRPLGPLPETFSWRHPQPLALI